MIDNMRRGADYLNAGADDMVSDLGEWLRPGQLKAALKRWAGLAAGGGFAVYLLIKTPVLMWPVTTLLVVAIFCRGRLIASERLDDVEFLQLLNEMSRGRNGVLLADVLDRLQAEDRALNSTVTDLRRACERLGVPVRKTLNVGGNRSIGVHRDDLLAAYRPAVSPEPTSPLSGGSSAGQGTTTSTVPIGGGGVAWSVHGSPTDAPAADEDAFEDHLADALALLDEEETDR